MTPDVFSRWILPVTLDQSRNRLAGWLCSSGLLAHVTPRFYPTVDETRRYRNFAPFVRQTGERKAQTCANGIFRQLTRRWTRGIPEFNGRTAQPQAVGASCPDAVC